MSVNTNEHSSRKPAQRKIERLRFQAGWVIEDVEICVSFGKSTDDRPRRVRPHPIDYHNAQMFLIVLVTENGL
jgi:hypothetical protein